MGSVYTTALLLDTKNSPSLLMKHCSELSFCPMRTMKTNKIVLKVQIHIVIFIECGIITVHVNAVLLKLAEGCSESDTHLMLGYLLAISKVL